MRGLTLIPKSLVRILALRWEGGVFAGVHCMWWRKSAIVSGRWLGPFYCHACLAVYWMDFFDRRILDPSHFSHSDWHCCNITGNEFYLSCLACLFILRFDSEINAQFSVAWATFLLSSFCMVHSEMCACLCLLGSCVKEFLAAAGQHQLPRLPAWTH